MIRERSRHWSNALFANEKTSEEQKKNISKVLGPNVDKQNEDIGNTDFMFRSLNPVFSVFSVC